jgi:predicted aminopeptidase/Fe2+ or Zn2+ uptake regulation protein
MTIGRFKFLWLVFNVLAVALMLSACSPFYVMQAAYEEGKILWRREPIADVLKRPDLQARTKERLALVLAVRKYAQTVVKLNVGGSYSTYSYVDTPDLTYILTAAPKTELKPNTWWFLFVGRVPYKGYFSREDATQAAAKLQSQGYDTVIRTTAAFSTLGWFDDPLLSHLLRYDRVTLANTIFHELLHNTLYVKGSAAFNESLANFVGGHAAIDFFRDRYGVGSAEHEQAVRDWERELTFADFLEGVSKTLNKLYALDIPVEEKLRLREEVFTRSKADWLSRLTDHPSYRSRYFLQHPLNNTVIIQYTLYLTNLHLLQAPYDGEGQNFARFVEILREAVPKGDDPWETVRNLLNHLSPSRMEFPGNFSGCVPTAAHLTLAHRNGSNCELFAITAMKQPLKNFQHALQEKGLKWTPPRRRVADVFSRERHPLTIAEVYRRLERKQTHLASVYRAVEALCRAGVLTKVDQVDEGQRYELSDEYRKHHHHLICQACGRVEDFEDCFVAEIEERIRRLKKFRVVKHEMRFLGVCQACAS